MRQYTTLLHVEDLSLSAFVDLIEEVHHIELEIDFQSKRIVFKNIEIDHYLFSHVFSFQYDLTAYIYHYMYNYTKQELYIHVESNKQLLLFNYNQCSMMIQKLYQYGYLTREELDYLPNPVLPDHFDFNAPYLLPVVYLPYNYAGQVEPYMGLFYLIYETEPSSLSSMICYCSSFKKEYQDPVQLLNELIDYLNSKEYPSFDEIDLLLENIDYSITEGDDQEMIELKKLYATQLDRLNELKNKRDRLKKDIQV